MLFQTKRLGWLAIAASVLMMAADSPQSQPDKSGEAEKADVKAGPDRALIIRVPLPIRGTADGQVKRQIEQAVAAHKNAGAGRERPIIVLEFHGDGDQDGEGSEYERALSLARFLAGRSMSGVRTVAFVPQTVRGHAILAALACEELIMSNEAQFGEAGVGETELDESMLAAYADIAKRRRIFPPALVLSMLDPSREVFQVKTLDGDSYVDAAALAEMKSKTAVGEVITIVRKGDLGIFHGEDLRIDYSVVSHIAADRKALAGALGVPPHGITEALTASGDWRAIRVNLHGRINSRTVSEAMQAIDQQIRTESANLLCLHINSPGGSVAQSAELANFLASFDASELRTIAFVEQHARGDAAIPAMACDDLVLTEDAILGGPGEAFITEEQRFDLKDPLKNIAQRKSRDWSLMLGLVDLKTTVYRFTKEGAEERIFCDEEWESREDREQWQRGAAIDLTEGMSAADAVQWKTAKQVATSFGELARIYNVEKFEQVERSAIVSAIERFASQRWLARLLLFIGFFALISEASAPGIGVPGFVSAVCFMLFFWMQFLNGTAGWLEVILFVGGLAFIALEVLALPGFGLFGAGGLLMVLISIVLATQTFVLPRNTYQYEELPKSLFTLIAGMAGTFVAVLIMRHLFPHTPFARRMMLLPPSEEEMAERDKRELLADFAHLYGRHGVAATQLTPSGKAMIGDELIDVISRGEVVAQGTAVQVVEAKGHRVVIEPVEAAEG